jgi:anti-sigma regulatory factor (Ser/Thr protein kinase)
MTHMWTQSATPVEDASQVGHARRAAGRAAESAGLSESRRGMVAIVTTELATNLFRYARNGRLLVQALRSAAGVCVEVLAIDSGPGMRDLSRCLEDGYSSGGTRGTGLGAVRRLSDEFDVYSTESGTVVACRIRADDWDAAARPRFSFGAVSIPAPAESVCGDSWRMAEENGAAAIMVADGLGHGPLAAEAAGRASRAFDSDPFAECDRFFERAHVEVQGSRGVAIARARVTATGGVRFAGVGNIGATLLGLDHRRGLPSQNGTVGVLMRKPPRPLDYDWPERGLLVMHSDGVMARWSVDPYPGLLVRHPAIVAATLFRDFVRGPDDATVVVIGVARGVNGHG